METSKKEIGKIIKYFMICTGCIYNAKRQHYICMDQFQNVTGIISELFSNHNLKVLDLIDKAEFT